jgi:hypothetical protein
MSDADWGLCIVAAGGLLGVAAMCAAYAVDRWLSPSASG